MGGLATAIALKFGASAATAATIGTVTTGALTIGGTALSVAGALQAGRAEGEQAGVETQFAENQALQEEIRGAAEERLRRKEGEKLKAQQIARFAGAGVRVGEGTPLLVMAETLLETEEDVFAIKEGTKARASAFRQTGQTFRSIGRQAKSTSRLKAGSSLLSGISDLTT